MAWQYMSARVTLQMGTLPGLQCRTDFAGRCAFAGAGGGDLLVARGEEGFYAAVEEKVQIAAGAAVEVTLAHQQEFHEVVNVKESAPAIDPAQVAAKEESAGWR